MNSVTERQTDDIMMPIPDHTAKTVSLYQALFTG